MRPQKEEKRVPTSLTLKAEDLELLNQLAEEHDLSKPQLLMRALRLYDRYQRNEVMVLERRVVRSITFRAPEEPTDENPFAPGGCVTIPDHVQE